MMQSSLHEREMNETMAKMSVEIENMQRQLNELKNGGLAMNSATGTSGNGSHLRLKRDEGTLVAEIRRLETIMARMIDSDEMHTIETLDQATSNVTKGKSTEKSVDAYEKEKLEVKLAAVTAAEEKSSKR